MVTEAVDYSNELTKKIVDTSNPMDSIAEIKGDVETVEIIPLKELEKIYIMQVLYTHKGNKTKAAYDLGITIKTLYNKLHGYGLFEKYQTQKKKAEINNEQRN